MSSYAVGTCIREKAGSGLSAQCAEYLDVMSACQADIDTFCNGLEFTGEVMGVSEENTMTWYISLFNLSLTHKHAVLDPMDEAGRSFGRLRRCPPGAARCQEAEGEVGGGEEEGRPPEARPGQGCQDGEGGVSSERTA